MRAYVDVDGQPLGPGRRLALFIAISHGTVVVRSNSKSSSLTCLCRQTSSAPGALALFAGVVGESRLGAAAATISSPVGVSSR